MTTLGIVKRLILWHYLIWIAVKKLKSTNPKGTPYELPRLSASRPEHDATLMVLLTESGKCL